LDVVLETSPETTDGKVWVMSAWRPGEGAHSWGEAFDIRVKNVKGFDVKTFAYNKIVAAWAEQIRRELGPEYDVVYGSESHFNHIHVEWDPR
jgi:hypothetical protein